MNVTSPVMAHEAMEYNLHGQLDHHVAEQPVPAEVVISLEGPPVFQALPAEVVISQEGPPVLQALPAEVVSSQEGPPLPQPAPHVSVGLTEEGELLGEDRVESINPGASEERRQRSRVNHPVRVSSLDSVNSFISGLHRLPGMLEFLRPPSDHNVGPVRSRRMRGSASRRSRTIGSQRTDSTRSRAPLAACFQVSPASFANHLP